MGKSYQGSRSVSLKLTWLGALFRSHPSKLFVAFFVFLSLPTWGEWTPNKSIRFIVGNPPGGATDLVARILQQRLGQELGKSVIVDNRAGANGLISLEILKNAEPDGYTVGLGHIGILLVSPTIQKVPFDSIRDFVPIGLMVSMQNIILTHPDIPVKNLTEYIALARTKPRAMQYATSGIGSPGHLAGALLEMMTGIELTMVPYKGGGPAITDLMAGHIPSFFAVISTGVPHVKSGKVRAIAVTSQQRAETLPEVPTIAESGIKGYSAINWYGLHAPAKTPAAVVAKLNKALTTTLNTSEVIEQLKQRGIVSTPSSSEAYGPFIVSEQKKWIPLIKQAKIHE